MGGGYPDLISPSTQTHQAHGLHSKTTESKSIDWNEKSRDPTMKNLRVKEEGTEDKLEEKFNFLQQDWDFYKKSNPGAQRWCSTDTYAIYNNALYMSNNSPRNLMSSLQQEMSETEGKWQMRSNDMAVEEIRRERKEAIESGKVRGRRRLFGAVEGQTEVGFGGREEIQLESEVRSVSSCASDDHDGIDNGETGSKDEVFLGVSYQSYSGSSSSLSGEIMLRENMEMEEEKMVVVASTEEKGDVGGGRRGYGGRWMVVMGWLVIVLIVSALGIVSVKSFDGFGIQNEVILIPT